MHFVKSEPDGFSAKKFVLTLYENTFNALQVVSMAETVEILYVSVAPAIHPGAEATRLVPTSATSEPGIKVIETAPSGQAFPKSVPSKSWPDEHNLFGGQTEHPVLVIAGPTNGVDIPEINEMMHATGAELPCGQ